MAEKLDGKPLARVMQDRLFGPLGPKNTAFPASSVNTIPDPYSHGYLYSSASVVMVGSTPYRPPRRSEKKPASIEASHPRPPR